MKWFWKYVFPALFGLAVYATIRVVNDTTTREKFWERSWKINVIEIVLVTLFAYVFTGIIDYFMGKFKQQKKLPTTQNVLKEFATLFLVSFILCNVLLFVV